MDNMELSFSQLRTSIEELEKRIKAISAQVTVGTQITATKACLEEIKEIILNFEASYNEHLNYCYLSESEHLKEFDNFKILVNKIKLSVETINGQISTMLNDIQNLKQNDETTKTSILNLEKDLNLCKENLQSLTNSFDTFKTNTQKTLNDVAKNKEDVSNLTTTLSEHTTEFNLFKTSTNESLNDLKTYKTESLQSIDTNKNNITENIKSINTLNDFKTTATDNLSTLNEFKDSMITNFNNLQKDYNTIKNLHNNNIVSLTHNQIEIKDNIQTINKKIEDLSAGSSSGGGDIKVFDLYKEKTMQKIVNGKIVLPYFFVISQQNQTALFKIKLTGTSGVENTNIKINLTVNNNVYTEDIYLTNLKFEQDALLQLNLNQKANLVKIELVCSDANLYIERTQVCVNATNVKISKFNLNNNICCFDNKYFVLFKNKNKAFKYCYYMGSSTSFNKSSLLDLQLSGFLNNMTNIKICPKLKNTTKLQYDGGKIAYEVFYICPEENHTIKSGKIDNLTDTNIILDNQNIMQNVVTFDNTYTGYECGGYSICAIDTKKQPYLIRTTTTGENMVDKILLHNQEILDAVDICIVKSNNCRLNRYPDNYIGCVITHENGKNYFYPNIGNSFNVELIDGDNVTAYYESDESINIYVHKNNDVYKFILTLNSNYDYQVSSTHIIKNCTKIEEGFYDNLFVYNGDNFEIKNISNITIE